MDSPFVSPTSTDPCNLLCKCCGVLRVRFLLQTHKSLCADVFGRWGFAIPLSLQRGGRGHFERISAADVFFSRSSIPLSVFLPSIFFEVLPAPHAEVE